MTKEHHFLVGLLTVTLLFWGTGAPSLAAPDVDDAAEYLRQVAELVIKKDAAGIHKRLTPEVQSRFSQKDITAYLNNALSGLGSPKGMTLKGFQMLPGNEYVQVQGELQFEKGPVLLTLTLKALGDGYQIHHMNLNFPMSEEKFHKWGQKPKRFLKEEFFPTLKDKGVDSAIGYVDKKVRAKVGDGLIKEILSPLSKIDITSIKSYDYEDTTEGITHRFVLVGSYLQSPCLVEIMVRENKGSFSVLDVNISVQE